MTKDEKTKEMEIVKDSLLARRALREWFELATPAIPARVLATRLEKTVERLLKIKGLYMIGEYI